MPTLNFQPVAWQDRELVLLDQRKLPLEIEYLHLHTVTEVWDAIRNLAVRGANAIGITAAYGLYLGVLQGAATREEFLANLHEAKRYLETARPTAIHMFWAMETVLRRVSANPSTDVGELRQAVLDEAMAIQRDDTWRCRKIGDYGLEALKELYRGYEGDAPFGILTHCNAGALGTSLYGTATAPMYLAQEAGLRFRVFADETRPVLQGARLTAWELHQANIDVTLICDNMAASVMRQGWVQVVFVGADRIAANGDTANKIGTYSVAVLAKEHGIPLYVAAPTSIIDRRTRTGDDIVIEQRPEEEVTQGLGKRISPLGVKVYNPAFDITPATFITGIVTEKGIISPPFVENIAPLAEA